MHTGQMIELVLGLVGDREGNRYSASQVLGVLSEGQRDWLRELSISVRKSAAVNPDSSSDPDTAFYDLPGDCWQIERIELPSGIPLTLCALPDVAERYVNWSAQTGTPAFAVYGHWGRKFRAVPYPETGEDLTLYYLSRGGDLALQQEPDIDPIYHMALVKYAAGELLLADEDHGDPVRAQMFRGDYMRALDQARSETSRGSLKGARTIDRRPF